MPELLKVVIFLYICCYYCNNRALGGSSDLIVSESWSNLSTSNESDQHHLSSDQLFCISSKEEIQYCTYNCTQVTCSENGPVIPLGCCATYDKDTRLVSFSLCPNFLARKSYRVAAQPGHILLPRNLSHLNDYMCSPLNRKGFVCSECADGFGPSVTSLGYRCANCTDAWCGVPLFLFLEFVPTTVFYLIILVFHVSITSAPMPCFIMYSQIITIMLYLISHGDDLARDLFSTESGTLRTDLKTIHTFYGIFNLDFFRLLFPPICISTSLKSLYIAFLGYIVVLYPLFLIFLTWVCVDLHDRNFRLLVWLWRPFHGCFVRLRRGWDTKSDIVDVFTTFFLLTYNKHLYQTVLMQVTQGVVEYDVSGVFVRISHMTFVDPSVASRSKYLLLFTVPVATVSYIFIILPPLLLALYPFKAFRLFLSKCHLNFIALNIFVDKVNGCYRNGLGGGRDMRSFSGLYFFIRIVLYLTGYLSKKLSGNIWSEKAIWFSSGTVFFTTALTIGLAQPYKKAYMCCIDTFLLANLALMCYVVLGLADLPRIVATRVLLFTPILAFVVIIMLNKLQLTGQNIKKLLFKGSKIQYVLQKVIILFSIKSDSEEHQPLIQPA